MILSGGTRDLSYKKTKNGIQVKYFKVKQKNNKFVRKTIPYGSYVVVWQAQLHNTKFFIQRAASETDEDSKKDEFNNDKFLVLSLLKPGTLYVDTTTQIFYEIDPKNLNTVNKYDRNYYHNTYFKKTEDRPTILIGSLLQEVQYANFPFMYINCIKIKKKIGKIWSIATKRKQTCERYVPITPTKSK